MEEEKKYSEKFSNKQSLNQKEIDSSNFSK